MKDYGYHAFGYSQEERDDIRKRFPNVNADEFRVEADRRLRDEMNIWIMEADWDDFDAEDAKRLRETLRSKDLEMVADAYSGDMPGFRTALEEFVDSDDLSPEYLEENGELIAETGKLLANDPLRGDDFLSLEHTHTIRAMMSFGGPGSSIYFTLNENGELIEAEAVYGWGQSHTMRIDDDVAEKLWNNFRHISDSIDMREDPYFKRKGPRM